MKMSPRIIHTFVQGSPEWHAHRRDHLNASEAPAAVGVSSYVKREDFVRRKATGEIDVEFSPQVMERFNDGHKYEAIARPWAEEIIGEELFPIIASREVEGLPLSASYDGATLDEQTIFEHKTLNQDLDRALRDGVIPNEYLPQLEQQMLVLGATRCLFMASKGERESMRYVWYEPAPGGAIALVHAWRIFLEDVAAYTPRAATVEATATAIEDLPTPYIDLTVDTEKHELVVASSLDVFKERLEAYLRTLPMEPKTDQDFADLDQAVKQLKTAEERLDAAEATALARLSSVDEMRRTVELLRETCRRNRLSTEKLVKAKKESIRSECVARGVTAIGEHLAKLNARLGGTYVSGLDFNFSAAISGKKTIDGLNRAIDTELTRAKIQASEIADTIEVNLKHLATTTAQADGLVPDLRDIVLKGNDDFANLIAARVAARQKRLDDERERIRLEEEARARAKVEAEARAAEEAKKAEEKKAEAVAAVAMPQQPAVAPVVTPAPAPAKGRSAPAKPARPSAKDLVVVAAGAFGITPQEALKILWNTNFIEVEQQLLALAQEPA